MGKVYKTITLVGTSTKGYEDAINSAIEEAAKTLKGMAWFEVKEMRGGIKDNKVAEYQAIITVGFLLISE
ncbi:MAG: dodecin flavoprotein [candidate division Zixibacteria bacterium]|nr:dodecin flavoprotein [candidate division Zixibacteria bacterium]